MDRNAFGVIGKYITALAHFTHHQIHLNMAKSISSMDHKQHKPDWLNHRINIVTRALWIQFMRNCSTSIRMLLHTNMCMRLRKKRIRTHRHQIASHPLSPWSSKKERIKGPTSCRPIPSHFHMENIDGCLECNIQHNMQQQKGIQ